MMKIAAIFCVALFAYAVVASSDDSEDGGTAGEDAGTKQYYMNNRYRYPQGYYRPAPTAARRRRNNIFSNPLYLIIILSILRSSATTAAPDTTTTPTTVTTVTTATTVTTVATTTSKYAGWTAAGGANCVYYLVLEAKTATAAKADCVTRGGAIASVGFNSVAATRTAIVNALNAQSVSFWVGATGTGTGTAGGTTTSTLWLNPATISPTAADASIPTVEDADGTAGAVCGRFPANNVLKLLFEDCDTEKFYYMCEYCGSIA